MRTTGSYKKDITRILNNTNADNAAWGLEMVNDSLRYLTTRYFWNEESINMNTIPNVQFYPLPAQLKKLVNITVLIGNVLWQPKECTSRQLWDALNVIQFQQEFPYYYFIWNGQLGIWPTPTSGSDVITINYKSRIVDLVMDDVTDSNTGYVVSATNGSTALLATGSGTTPFLNWMAQSTSEVVNVGDVTGLVTGTTVSYATLEVPTAPMKNGTRMRFNSLGSYTGISGGTTSYYLGNVTGTTFSLFTDASLNNIVTVGGSGTANFTTYYQEIANPAGSSSMIQIPFTNSNATCGDNQWYPIAQVVSGTMAYLSQPYQGQTTSGSPFTIGQVPLLIEDYQDLPLYRMGYLYYTTRLPDPQRAQLYDKLYQEGFNKLDDEFSNKSTGVVLSDMDQPMVNPNLFVPRIS